jgi:outer membrane protein TolC
MPERPGQGVIDPAASGLLASSSGQPGNLSVTVQSVETPAIPPPAHTMVLDLPEALGLAGAENPTIAMARTAVTLALAGQLQARALLLPTLNAGVNFDYHAGNLQSSIGALREVDRHATYVGAGAGAVSAGTVAIPGVQIYSPLADAVFAPKIAGDVVATQRFEASATNNNVLLDVGVRYYDLVGAEGRLAVIRQSEADVAVVARLTADHAENGQGRPSDADRARSEALLMHQQEQRTQEEVGVASARLAQVLSVDPSSRLTPRPGPVELLHLVDPDRPINSLIETALAYRPEMAARAAAIAASQERFRQERARPFLPTISIGYSAGGFGGTGSLATPTSAGYNGRTDFDVYAYWTWENLGLGNLALQKRRRAEVQEAEADRVIMVNRIRDEVAEAVAQASASQRALEAATRQFQRAQAGYQRDLQRVRALVGLPIEVLSSVRLLASARRQYVDALIGFNQAQLRLFVALGQPPTEAGPVMNAHAACQPVR